MVTVKGWAVLEWQVLERKAWAGRNSAGAGGKGTVSRERWQVQKLGQQHKVQALW